MSDLVAFLRARLEEDRAYADALAGEYAKMGPVIEGVTENKLHALIYHTARRTLREAGAKRAILNAYDANNSDAALHLDGPTRKHGEWDGLRFAVRQLAAVYSDHPDYQPEWKP